MRKKLEHENFRSLKKTIAKYSIALCNYVCAENHLKRFFKTYLIFSKTKNLFCTKDWLLYTIFVDFKLGTFFENTKSSLMLKNVSYDSMTQWVELFSTVVFLFL